MYGTEGSLVEFGWSEEQAISCSNERCSQLIERCPRSIFVLQFGYILCLIVLDLKGEESSILHRLRTSPCRRKDRSDFLERDIRLNRDRSVVKVFVSSAIHIERRK